MTKENFEPKPLKGPMYAVIYPFLAARCHERGYALAIHGTLGRDLDLVAIPWTEDAKSAEELVAHICDVMDGTIWTTENVSHPTDKPHGRRAWSLLLKDWCGSFIDLSVMPRIPKAAEVLA